jgi:hypothetical protein
MNQWSLSDLLSGLHEDVETQLSLARRTMGHAVAKGDASEGVWLGLLRKYLPERYQAAKAFVVDSDGVSSNQIDVLVFDRQYSPFIFEMNGQTVVPAESVYAVFEAKQSINAAEVRYAKNKVASVRRLHRTTQPIPHAGGVHDAKTLPWIIGGLLTLESDWRPPLGAPLADALEDAEPADGCLDLGCVAAHGTFGRRVDLTYELRLEGKPATAFLFELIARLQSLGTVPMMDIQAYAKWLRP